VDYKTYLFHVQCLNIKIMFKLFRISCIGTQMSPWENLPWTWNYPFALLTLYMPYDVFQKSQNVSMYPHIIHVVTLALGLWPRQELVKVWAKSKARESHFMLPGVWKSVREMNLHTPKWVPTLGVGIPLKFWIFKEWLQGSKHIGLRNSLYHWKTLGT